MQSTVYAACDGRARWREREGERVRRGKEEDEETYAMSSCLRGERERPEPAGKKKPQVTSHYQGASALWLTVSAFPPRPHSKLQYKIICHHTPDFGTQRTLSKTRPPKAAGRLRRCLSTAVAIQVS